MQKIKTLPHIIASHSYVIISFIIIYFINKSVFYGLMIVT